MPKRIAILVLVMLLPACRQDMHDQPRYEPFERNPAFDDQRASRPLVPGTVARGGLQLDDALYRGIENGEVVAHNALKVDWDLLQRGRERYDIYCSPCHDRVGRGRGMIVRRGFPQPPSFHDERLRSAPDGHFFQVVTNGFGRMKSYAGQVKPHDRWAIIAYIRALQHSQSASLDEVPPRQRRLLESGQ
jgi:mono/diheme cytochrome c family protein